MSNLFPAAANYLFKASQISDGLFGQLFNVILKVRDIYDRNSVSQDLVNEKKK